MFRKDAQNQEWSDLIFKDGYGDTPMVWFVDFTTEAYKNMGKKKGFHLFSKRCCSEGIFT